MIEHGKTLHAGALDMDAAPQQAAIPAPSASAPIRVLLADDHLLLREGVAEIISSQTDMAVVGFAENGLVAVSQYRALLPDVVLMDLQMPELNGVNATLRILAEFPTARILILTTYSGDVLASRALRAGAAGYLLKDTLRTELLEAIRSIHNGGRPLAPSVAHGIALHAARDMLTERETAVLQHAANGRSNRQIAAALRLSEETVKGHMKLIFAKLDASGRTEAVTIGLKRGIIAV